MILSGPRSGQSAVQNRVALLTLAVVAGALFLVANRGAYKGFFTGDDFDNMANARSVNLSYFGEALIKPLGGQHNFRPVAHLYYLTMERVAGLHFRPYVAGIQVLHLLNVFLVWTLVRALGADLLGAAAAALLFIFNMAVFQVYWEPMYIFDLVCGTCTLLCLLSYVGGRLFLSLVLFWLALKAKEVAIVIPVVLAAYEWWFGGKRWKRLVLFFGISAILGAQAVILNAGRHDDYSLHFTPAAVWTCANFYAAELLPGPAVWKFAGFSILVLPFFIRDRRVRFGVFSFICLLGLMLFLPGRLFGTYLYVPLIGLAIALSAATRPMWLAVFFAVWIPWNYHQLRIEGRSELAAAGDRRAWFEPVANYVRTHADIDTFVYNDVPETLGTWGVRGILRSLRPGLPTTATSEEAPEAMFDLEKPNLAVLAWYPQLHCLRVVSRSPDVSYIRLSPSAPMWQLGEGWIGNVRNFRWIGPHATARLLYSASAGSFEVAVWVPPVFLEKLHRGRLDISLNHQPLGSGILEKPALNTFRFDSPRAPAGPVEVEFDVSPALKDPRGAARYYGAAVVSFGFLP